jgi:hypothetical protein
VRVLRIKYGPHEKSGGLARVSHAIVATPNVRLARSDGGSVLAATRLRALQWRARMTISANQ